MCKNFYVSQYLLCTSIFFSCRAVTQKEWDQQLFNAALTGDIQAAHYALANGANNNELPIAAARGHLPPVQFLIQHGADIHAENDEALRSAAIWDH